MSTSSDYKASFYARPYSMKQLDRITRKNLDRALIFKPFDNNSIFPTDTTGVIPMYPLDGGALRSTRNFERNLALTLEVGALIAFAMTVCCGCSKL